MPIDLDLANWDKENAWPPSCVPTNRGIQLPIEKKGKSAVFDGEEFTTTTTATVVVPSLVGAQFGFEKTPKKKQKSAAENNFENVEGKEEANVKWEEEGEVGEEKKNKQRKRARFGEEKRKEQLAFFAHGNGRGGGRGGGGLSEFDAKNKANFFCWWSQRRVAIVKEKSIFQLHKTAFPPRLTSNCPNLLFLPATLTMLESCGQTPANNKASAASHHASGSFAAARVVLGELFNYALSPFRKQSAEAAGEEEEEEEKEEGEWEGEGAAEQFAFPPSPHNKFFSSPAIPSRSSAATPFRRLNDIFT